MAEQTSHWISGIVITGDGRGRDMGFPTANLRLEQESQRPADGIYVCWVKINNETATYKGVMHVGPRPTIKGAQPSVEIHLLETPHIDLYNQVIRFKIAKYLRAIKKFNSLEELTEAIKTDCNQARAYLQENPRFI